MMAAHGTPSGRNQEIDRAVAIDITQSHCVEAERISRRAAGKSSHQAAVFARVEISAPRRLCDFAVLPCADDEIVVAFG